MAGHTTLQPHLQLVRDPKARSVLRSAWQGKNTASGLRQKVAWPMWLVYSWIISQLSCLVCILHTPKFRSRNWSCEDTTAMISGQKSHSFHYESTVIRRTLDIASRTMSSYVKTLDMSATDAIAFTRLSSANPWFPCPTCFYFEVCTDSVW